MEPRVQIAFDLRQRRPAT